MYPVSFGFSFKPTSSSLKKLEQYGIRGIALEWFKSYHTEREQFVIYKCVDSKVLIILCGVPQGSVLGPLLFILYWNDIPHSLTYCKAIMFADDTTVYLSGENITELFSNMNHDLAQLNDWFRANKLSLNVSKPNYVIFKKKSTPPMPDNILYIGNNKLENVRYTKFPKSIYRWKTWMGPTHFTCKKQNS